MGFYTFKGIRKCASRGRIVYTNPKNLFFLNDNEVSEEEYEACFPAKKIEPGAEYLPGHSSACWPQVMEALAVHPSQVDQANARAKLHGIDAVYEKGTGMVALGSRNDRAKLIKLEGVHDKSGGYSDG